MFDLTAALNEVTTKSPAQIEAETAYKWASRAIICYRLFVDSGDLKRFAQAVDYHHEALEHSADAGLSVLKKITKVLEDEQTRTIRQVT